MSLESELTLGPVGSKRGGAVFKENLELWINMHTHNRYHEDTTKEF